MSQTYNIYAQKRLRGEVSWDTSRIRLILFNENYVFDAEHESLDEVLADVTRISNPLTGKTSVDGVAFSQPAIFTDSARVSGETVSAALWNDSGDYLMAYFDGDDVPGLPFDFGDLPLSGVAREIATGWYYG